MPQTLHVAKNTNTCTSYTTLRNPRSTESLNGNKYPFHAVVHTSMFSSTIFHDEYSGVQLFGPPPVKPKLSQVFISRDTLFSFSKTNKNRFFSGQEKNSILLN